jgi:hypothetical protein
MVSIKMTGAKTSATLGIIEHRFNSRRSLQSIANSQGWTSEMQPIGPMQSLSRVLVRDHRVRTRCLQGYFKLKEGGPLKLPTRTLRHFSEPPVCHASRHHNSERRAQWPTPDRTARANISPLVSPLIWIVVGFTLPASPAVRGIGALDDIEHELRGQVTFEVVARIRSNIPCDSAPELR